MGSAVAIGGLALGLGQSIFGISQQSKAKKEAERLKRQQRAAVNPYASLTPSTLGANQESQQSLRSLATQTNAFANAGGRAMSFIPQAARQNALVGQNIASQLDLQQRAIDEKIAYGEQVRMGIEEQRFNNEMQGFGAQYAAGQSNAFGGLNMMAGVMASGLGEGGVWNKN